MTAIDDRSFPPALTALSEAEFDHRDGDGVDYEPFADFLGREETTAWLRAWTGNGEVDGGRFRVFGQDGTGGYAAFWLVRPGLPTAAQPVVFLGSEGEAGVVARDLDALLWLFADGFGPCEAIRPAGRLPYPSPELAAIAERYAPGLRRPATEIIEEVGQEFLDFEDIIADLCR
ncbi:SMI1/KNR4 family protein [Kitasatospora sp. NPDC094015]|uniref:SMI1/KNR4 family protein n=1 Tax=Kitasatospora sp. NPDC094015 TaxID=3155205 RepID=UPI00333192A1